MATFVYDVVRVFKNKNKKSSRLYTMLKMYHVQHAMFSRYSPHDIGYTSNEYLLITIEIIAIRGTFIKKKNVLT